MEGVEGLSCFDFIFVLLLFVINSSFAFCKVILSCLFNTHCKVYCKHLVVSKAPPEKCRSSFQAFIEVSIVSISVFSNYCCKKFIQCLLSSTKPSILIPVGDSISHPGTTSSTISIIGILMNDQWEIKRLSTKQYYIIQNVKHL